MKDLIIGHYGWFGLTGDWKKHLINLRKNGANWMRIFGQYAWPKGRGTYSPFKLLTDLDKINKFPWNPPLPGEEARKNRYFLKDGYVRFRQKRFPGIDLPVYDLDFLDPIYFDKLQELFEFCGTIGMGIVFELEDWCSLKHEGIEKYRHPYFVSPQAHSAKTPGGLFGAALKKYMIQYWNKVFSCVRFTELMRFSVMNEYDFIPSHVNPPNPQEEERLCKDWYDAAMWDDHDRTNIIYWWVGSCMSKRVKLIAPLVDLYFVHGVGNKASYNYEVEKFKQEGYDFTKYPKYTILAGDGFSTGTGQPDFKGRKGITLKETNFLIRCVNEGHYQGYEALIRYRRGHANGTFEEFDTKYNGYTIVKKLSKGLGIKGGYPTSDPPPESPKVAKILPIIAPMAVSP